jgi:REP element-mobilizing transposase RayT
MLRSDPGRQFVAFDRLLDSAGSGPLWLSDPVIARFAESAILKGADLGHFVLYTYVVMPNHVHILLQPRIALARITNAIKGVAARHANAKLGRTGKPFWQAESFDHWIRSDAQFERIRHYIEWNPVSAHLAATPAGWKWSGANPQSNNWIEEIAARSRGSQHSSPALP